MEETCSQDWTDWLESATQQDLYIANKYITNEPSDYSSTHVPALKTTFNNIPGTAEDNIAKAKALADSFFPLPPTTSRVPLDATYPTPLKGIRGFSQAKIRQVVRSLSPYKVPGPDKIPNVVLIKCCNALINHLYFIFKAVFELNTYHPRWLKSVTLVLRKIGKMSYDVAKSYRPIGLIDTIPKLFSTLCSKHISFLAEKHSLLPPTQFGGRPGRNTTDAMLLVAHKVKEAWRRGKVATALFLDVQGTFPNMVKDQLIHNMRMRRVPECFIKVVTASLTGCTTRLKFDNYLSEALQLDNGTMQGNPSSMLYYSFYNMPLIKVALLEDELSPGFVDDSMMLAIGNTLMQCHAKLKDMMERPGGGFKWSFMHNSPFELSKTALMNFPRSLRDPTPGSLSLDRPNPDGTTTNSLTAPITSYKYLGVIFDPKLRWSLQYTKALAIATFWASKIWWLSKSASGVSTTGTKQLYNMVAIPRFTYGAEVWYTPLHRPEGAKNMRGLVGITAKLCSVQCKVTKAIMGRLSTTAGDVLDIHSYILPVDLLFNKLLTCVALRLCSLPKSHPLNPITRSLAHCKAKRHRSPLHNLIRLAQVNPKEVEDINLARRSPGYVPSFNTMIPSSKDKVLTFANLTNSTIPVHVYSDGSGYEGGIGASALLYINNRLIRKLRIYLGTALEHTVYEAEGVGILMGIHLLHRLSRQLTHPTILGSNSQAAIRALGNQSSHSSQYILDAIHKAAECLHVKQDGIINRVDWQHTLSSGEQWVGRKKGVFDLQLHWVPGHCNFEPNE